MVRTPPWSRRDRDLTARQRSDKAKLLEAISLDRREKESFETAIGRVGLDLKRILKNTDALKKVRGKYVPKVRDRIPRSLRFYEKGKLRHAEVANSQAASDIGQYWNAIRELTETGKSAALRSFKRQRFKDINGRFHTLEKDPQTLLALERRKPKPETFEIYRR